MREIKHTARPTSTKQQLGIGWFIAAVIFLFNPCLNIVDILPDFFGYIFLIKGLEKWADLSPNTAEAVSGFVNLRYVMLAKLICIVLIPLVDSTFDLLLTFAFITLELIYVIPAVGRMFDGFEYLGTRFGGDSIFISMKDVRLMTNIFFIIKSVFCVLPELTSLISAEASGYYYSGMQADFSNYKGLLTVIGLVVSTAIGIMWLSNILPYIKRIAGDTPFLERALAEYEAKIAHNTGLAIRRNLHTAFTLFTVGTVFLPNIWMDGVNVIPNFVGALFFLAALIILRRLAEIPMKWLLVSGVFAFVSAISFVISFIFGLNFAIYQIPIYSNVAALFNASRIASAFEYAAMAAVIFIIYRELREISRTHLPAAPEINDSKLVDIYNLHKRESDRRIKAWFVVAIITLISNIAFILLRADIKTDFWVIPFILSVITVGATFATLSHLYDRIEYKYI